MIDKIEMRKRVSHYLSNKFIDWQKALGTRKTIRSWADYLGVGETVLARWIRGDSYPRGKHVVLLANTFGPEFYDFMEWPRPKGL